jgi:glycosyltransferase involved in cell wall biosynthesis
VKEKIRRADIALYMRALYNGGTEQVMVNLAGEFQRRGLAVVFLVDMHNAYSPFIARLPPGVEYVSLDAKGPFARFRKLRDFLKQRSPHALIAAGYYPNIIAILARRRARVATRVIVTEHNSPTVIRQLSAPWQARRWFSLFAKALYPQAHGIVAVSQGTAHDLAQEIGLAPHRITTIYNPVIEDALIKAASEPIPDPWFQDASTPVVLAIGRLEPQKNYASLIRAIAIVNKSRPCRLLILGEGSERAILTKQIEAMQLSEIVRLGGFAENPHMYTARASMLVLSSVWEGLSCVLIEALALGTPAVATNCPFGPAEVLKNGRYGTLVPVDDDDALAKAILRNLSCDRVEVDQEWLAQFTTRHSADKYLRLIDGTEKHVRPFNAHTADNALAR